MFFTNLINFLRGSLPFYTTLFDSSVNISNIDYDNTHLTITTIQPHNLLVGNYTSIRNVLHVWGLQDINYNTNTGILSATLPPEHEVFRKGDKSLNVRGDYAGTVTLLNSEVSHDNRIHLVLPKNLTITNLEVVKDLPLYVNNFYSVDDVIDNNTFKVLYQNKEIAPLNIDFTGGEVINQVFLDGGYDFESYVLKVATKDLCNKNRLYIEHQGNTTSRDNKSISDFSRTNQPHTMQNIISADTFNIYFIRNTTNESSKVAFVEQATREVRNILISLLQNNSQLDIEDGAYGISYEQNAPAGDILSGQTNFSVWQYQFYLQSRQISDIIYNRIFVKRIKKICNGD